MTQAHSPAQERPSSGPSKGRVEAFSDGVFAVAITLLVLDIALDKPAENGQLWHELGGLGYHYAAYAISFLTIGIMWYSHHNLFSVVKAVDRGLLYSNLLLLAVVSFLPFPTGVLSEYVHGHGGENMRAAIAFYGITLTALSTAFTLLWFRVYRTPKLRAPWVTQADIRGDMLRSGSAIPIYVAATALTPIAPTVTLAIFTGLIVVFIVARTPETAVERDKSDDLTQRRTTGQS